MPVFMTLMLFVGHSAPPPHTRTYYVAADEIVWNYVPQGKNVISGMAFDSVERPFVTAGPNWIGGVAKKAIYREYTDSTFTTLKPRAPGDEYLGFLGPLMRAVVGDTIRVFFKNNTAFPVGMHPHGVFYSKDSEGAPYVDGTSGTDKADDAVPPGGRHTYLWPVPERAGPASGDGSSVAWMYHSHVHDEGDISTGLMGPIIITARKKAKADGTPVDVDREFVVMFYEVDENTSNYLQQNLAAYRTDTAKVSVSFGFGLPQAGGGAFQFNTKETLNGFMYGNGPMPTMKVGDRVRWYLMAGTGFEFHSPHWHGNTVEIAHMRTDVGALLPMGMVTADMVPDNPGIWLFHCHVSPHLRMGMQMRYQVTSR